MVDSESDEEDMDEAAGYPGPGRGSVVLEPVEALGDGEDVGIAEGPASDEDIIGSSAAAVRRMFSATSVGSGHGHNGTGPEVLDVEVRLSIAFASAFQLLCFHRVLTFKTHTNASYTQLHKLLRHACMHSTCLPWEVEAAMLGVQLEVEQGVRRGAGGYRGRHSLHTVTTSSYPSHFKLRAARQSRSLRACTQDRDSDSLFPVAN